MLLGAWPIGGVKRNNVNACDNKTARCRFVILCAGYALFLVIGASIFSVIEAPQLDRHYRELIATKKKFLEQNSCVASKY